MGYKGANTPMGPSSEFIYLVGTNYEGRIGSRFTFMHKGVLVTMQDCIGVSEQGVWIGIINKLVGLLG